MWPILFHVGPFPLHTYGLLIAIGFLFAVWHIGRLAQDKKQSDLWNKDQVVDWCFYALLVGFLGARLLWVFTQFSYFIEHPIEIFSVWEGGLVFYGGPLLVIPWTIWYCKRRGWKFLELSDMALQGLALAHAFGRLGCLAAGCCYGEPTHLPWGIIFNSDLVEHSHRGIPLHPTQLYESFSLFLLFGLMYFVYKRKKYLGQVSLLYFMGYPIIRFTIEFVRGDLVRGFIFDTSVSTSQAISIAVFLVALVLNVYLKKDHKTRNNIKND